jgi:hypothetical protein
MFAKLKYKYLIDTYSEKEEFVSYGKDVNGKFKGIKYLNTTVSNIETILEIFPPEYRKDFSVSLMKVSSQIPPHTDSMSQTVINFYIKTENCTTQFYDLKVPNPRCFQIPNQTNGFIFEVDDLIPTESFVAEDGDAYVLNVSRPHAVFAPTEPDRVALSISTFYPFEKVIYLLKETGNI